MTVSNAAQVRALDPNDADWTFGQSGNNFARNNVAVAQNIRTRLSMFFGECFFSLNQGIDYLNLLGQKNQNALNLAISATILNTTDVVGLRSLSAIFDHETREYTVSYQVQTTYSVTLSSEFTFSLNGTQTG